MSNIVILNWRPFEYKAKFEKRPLLFRSKIGIFGIFFKRVFKSFEDLQVNSNWKFQTHATISHKVAGPFKLFVKLHKSPLLIANMVEGAVLGLRQFLATECP